MSEKQLNEPKATEDGPAGEQPDPTLVERLKKMCPHFFSAAIERHRRSSGGQEPAPKQKLWSSVTRKLSGGSTVFVHLHIDSRFRKFEFRDNSGIERWPVDESQLEQAITPGGTYVGIRLGTEILRLNREELLSGFNRLRALRTKQSQS